MLHYNKTSAAVTLDFGGTSPEAVQARGDPQLKQRGGCIRGDCRTFFLIPFSHISVIFYDNRRTTSLSLCGKHISDRRIFKCLYEDEGDRIGYMRSYFFPSFGPRWPANCTGSLEQPTIRVKWRWMRGREGWTWLIWETPALARQRTWSKVHAVHLPSCLRFSSLV